MSSLPSLTVLSDRYSCDPPITPIVFKNLKHGCISLDQFKQFYVIENCFDIIVNINSKIAKLVIMGCKSVRINVDNPIIGTIDLIRMNNVVMNINNTVNIIQIDISSHIQINQEISEVSYVSCHSANIKVGNFYLPINEFSSTQNCTVINKSCFAEDFKSCFTEETLETLDIIRPLNETEQFIFE